MTSLKHDNDYTCIWFFSHRTPIKWKYVHNVLKSTQDINRLHGQYNFVNVFNRRTGERIVQFKTGQFIEPFPK